MGVEGIGGVFFRAQDPDALRRWYADTLGFSLEDYGGGHFTAAEGDLTVWSISSREGEYWPQGQELMVNYRVSDLDETLERLRASGAEVDAKVEEYDYGRFGWAVDPEGNRFELWQPARPG